MAIFDEGSSTSRFRVTVRGTGIELRGYIDVDDDNATRLIDLADAMIPYGLVIASPAESGYDPFTIHGVPIESVWEMQAQVIRAERAMREKVEAELRERSAS